MKEASFQREFSRSSSKYKSWKGSLKVEDVEMSIVLLSSSGLALLDELECGWLPEGWTSCEWGENLWTLQDNRPVMYAVIRPDWYPLFAVSLR